jgi:ubiquinone/menaquinone biosynthesis C-methylase UbiE
MGLYQDRILPHLIHVSMRQKTFTDYRQRITSLAEGDVLEIGIGSGLNVPLYGGRVAHLFGIDPSARLLSMARRTAADAGRSISLLEGSGEAIALEDDSVDTVVTTWTLCTIPNVTVALDEIRRVLRPSGRLLFVEHGRAPDASVRRWQDRLTPLWKRVGGGCHLNRPIRDLVESAGFRVDQIRTGYMKGPKPMTFMYEGSARPN